VARHGDPRPEPEAPADAPTTGRWTRLRPFVPLAVVALVAVGAYAAGTGTDDQPSAKDTAAQLGAAVKTAVDEALDTAASKPPDATASYQVIAPSLVVVQVERPATPDAEASGGLGTGVIINDQGAVLTARHVIAGGGRVTVTFSDGSTTDAVVASEQADQDIAVLTPSRMPEVIVPAVMGRVPPIGGPVFAVGHPLGLTWSLSAGVVSGLDRSIGAGDLQLEGLIQFDAAVNPGNSGGPLLNRAGQVVGIVTALANPSKQGFFVGIGFAVPIGAAAGGAGGPSQ
jgi:S1-C subfamily serine protease